MSLLPDRRSASARRLLSRQVRDAFPRMGVYAIRDKETGKALLVASSRNVDGAINRARFELRLRSHSNKELQAEWDSNGPERFIFEILVLLKENDDPEFNYAEELRALEQLYREEFKQREGEAR